MKRIVSLILCLALTAALLPAAAMAEDGTCGDSHSWVEATCVTPMTCTACGATQGDVAEHTNHTGLTELTGSSEELFSEVLRSGNYYLGEDITLDFEHYIELFDEVNICLNGHKLMLDATSWGDAPVFFVSGTLRVYDCGDTLRTYTADENGLWVPAENGEHATFGGVICGGTGDNYTYSGNHGGMTSSDTAQGGAVFCLGRFELHGGNIVGNSADYGAGVYVGGGSFLMTNGRIVGNSATDGEGGGVYVDRARFTMTAGSIDSNRANRGSAIYQSGTGTVEISGCVINENTAQDKGAVYIQDSMSVSGETCIMENFSGTGVAPNLYLASGVCVDVGDLNENADIFVYAQDLDTPFTTGGGEAYRSNFESDHADYRIITVGEELAFGQKSLCETHVPGETVQEEGSASTCTEEGFYYQVISCTVCGEELTRDRVTLPLKKHVWGEPTAAFKRTCGVCGTTEEVDSISGETDDELEWVLTKDGVLTVSGEGECIDLEDLEAYDVRTVILEEGITALSSRAIKMLPNVTSLSLPKSMEDLDADAINRYMPISSISVAEGNPAYTVWDRMLFNRGMTELLCAPRCGIDETVTVPEGVRFINGYAFANSWVTELSLPISLETVNTYAFDGCDDLETVAYPGTKAAWTAMVTVKAYNTALEDADFTYGTVDSFSGTCGDDAVWALTLSDGVLTISGTGTVDDQGWPRSVVEKAVLQEGITAIEEEVFYKHTALTELTLPKSLTFIGESNFDGGSLDTVTYNGSEPQWGLVSVSDGNDDLLEADMLFDSRLIVEWNAPHTVLSISGMIRDSAWVTVAFYEADGRMAFVKHYAAAAIKNGVGIYSEAVDLTVCSAKVMILDENYAPMGLPYVLGAGAGGSGDTITAWLYATDKAYIDGKKKAASGTLLFSDGSNTYEMEAGKGTPGTWELGQAFDLTLDANGEVTSAVLSRTSQVDECFLLHVNVEEDTTDITFEFGELSGSFADDEIPCLVLEPGCDGVPEDMEADTMAAMAETRVSHLYRAVDKEGDGKIDYLLVKPTLYGLVAKAVKDYVMLEDNQGEKMTETVSGDTEWYLEDTLDIEDLPAVGTILKLTWNIDTGLYEVEELKEQQGELMSLGSRNLKFDFGVAYVADDGWVDVDDMDEEIIYKVLMDEKLLVWAEEIAVDYADLNEMYNDAADVNEVCHDAVELVSLLGIMNGDSNGNFNPNRDVKRSEMSKLLYVILNSGEDDNVENWLGEVHYTDLTDHWCEGYANYCGTLKLEPVGGAFRPGDAITVAEACRMLLCATDDYDIDNYTDEDWEMQVLADAEKAGLLNDFSYDVDSTVPRQWMAKLLENYLTQMTVTDGKKEVTPGEKYFELTEGGYLWEQVYGGEDKPAVLFTQGWLYVTEWVQTTKYGDIYRVVFENGENGEILLNDTPVTDVLYAYTCDEVTNQYTLTLVEPGTQDGEIVDLHNDRGVELEDADEKYLSMKGVTVALMKVTVMDGEAYSRTIAFYDPDDLNDPDISNDREGESWIQYTDYYFEAGKLLYVVAYQIDEDDLADDPKLPNKLEELFRQMVGLSE